MTWILYILSKKMCNKLYKLYTLCVRKQISQRQLETGGSRVKKLSRASGRGPPSPQLFWSIQLALWLGGCCFPTSLIRRLSVAPPPLFWVKRMVQGASSHTADCRSARPNPPLSTNCDSSSRFAPLCLLVGMSLLRQCLRPLPPWFCHLSSDKVRWKSYMCEP